MHNATYVESPAPSPSLRQDSDELPAGFSLDLGSELLQSTFSDDAEGQLPDGNELLDFLNRDLAQDYHATSLTDGVMNINLMPDESHVDLAVGEDTNPILPVTFSLQQWLVEESNKQKSAYSHLSGNQLSSLRASLLRKVTVGFAICKLLEDVRIAVSNHSLAECQRLCSVENFVVRALQDGAATDGWEVVGVDMISHALSVNIVTTSSCSRGESSRDDDDAILGRRVSAVVTQQSTQCYAIKTDHQNETRDESLLCHSLGVLLQFIFLEENTMKTSTQLANFENGTKKDKSEQPRRIKSACASTSHTLSRNATAPLVRLIQDLLDCNVQDVTSRPVEAYSSLAEVAFDMHLLLGDPNNFLFERGTTSLHDPTGEVYGRAEQISALNDAFNRVASTGKSEAFLIGGYSGSGKTKLVQSVFDSVISSSNGVFISQKFEATSSSPLSVVLSAFDDLCMLLTSRNSETEQQHIYEQLAEEFGDSLFLLVRTVPNVVRLAPSLSHASSVINEAATESEVNFFSLCNIIQRFMRIVSNISPPVVIFLDDLQWADAVSFGLIHTLLSDTASSLFFVGTYRDNEVSPAHIIFGFRHWLSNFNVPLNMIKITGVALDDVNSMVSDVLGVLPRICRSLSKMVFLKTKGNPFFVQTFVRSLVDKGMLTYSLRERSWSWDIDKINTENITPNVLDLLSSKMAYLSENIQTALKVASCFGIKVDTYIVQTLSKTPQHSSLINNLAIAVEDGLMDSDSSSSCYRFVHDNVREAAYGMISPNDRNRFHFEIGMHLLNNCEDQPTVKNQCLFVILDQINHGVPSLCDESQSISIANLNLEAGLISMLQSNYTSGYNYAKYAISLLSEGFWSTQYELCLKLHCLLAKTAYSRNRIDEAKSAAKQVVEHSTSYHDKVDGYDIQHSIIMNICDPADAVRLECTILELLESMGEHMPPNLSDEDIESEVAVAIQSFESNSDHDLQHMYTNSNKDQAAIIRAYYILCRLNMIGGPARMRPYYHARWFQFCLKHKVTSKYLPMAYVSFAAILCMKLDRNMEIGHRIGKLGMNLLDAVSSSAELPNVHLYYYGHVGVFFEPIQAVVEMHRKAYVIGYQIGDLANSGLHKLLYAVRQFYAGTNLVKLKEELEHDFKSEEYHCSFPMLGKKLKYLNTTITRLIGDEESSIMPRSEPTLEVFDEEPAFIAREMACLTYRGHFERVNYMAKRWEDIKISQNNNYKTSLNLRSVYVCFYSCLSLLVTGWRKKPNQSRVQRLLLIVKLAARHSSWNFKNKVDLIIAEQSSLSEMNPEAEVAYCTAIKAAHESKFVHEEGLACELAGMHYERVKNIERALCLFKRARECYNNWGSQMKVQMMQEKIQYLSHKPSS